LYATRYDPIGTMRLSESGTVEQRTGAYGVSQFHPAGFTVEEDLSIVCVNGEATADDTGRVVAFDRPGGTVSWEFSVPNFHNIDHLVADRDAVYFATRVDLDAPDSSKNRRPNVYAIERSSGEKRWSTTNVGSSNWLVNLDTHGETVYAFHQSGLVAYDKQSGDRTLRKEMTNGIGAIRNGVAYLSGRPLRAVQLSSFDEQWTTEREKEMSLVPPAVGDEHVVFADQGGTVYCLKRANGDVVWTATVSTEVTRTPKLRSGLVWIIDDSGLLQGLDLTNGRTRYTKNVPSDVSFEVLDRTLVVRSEVEESYDSMFVGYRLSE
jgi:outer membrane protein assembly factor BamB